MWYTILYVYGGLSRKRPKEVFKIGIDEHRTSHTGNGEVGAFGNTILRWGIRDCFFVRDSHTFAVGLHFPMHQFGCIVHLENGNGFSGKVLRCCAVLNKGCQRVIADFKKNREMRQLKQSIKRI